MRFGIVVLWALLCSVTSATAQLRVGIGLPGVSIGINLPVYPQLVPVPGYPVYYAPRVDSNYFFYDGMYWVYQDDNWYASSWYNGPWGLVAPEVVPLYILRVPVRYYRQPPAYFRGWRSDAPPRWGEHWGHEWEQRRGGWDRWNRGSAPAPAPLPFYQRQYSGDRYPRADQQNALQSRNYRYQPRDTAVREHYQQQGGQRPPAPAERRAPAAPPERNSRPQQFDHRDASPSYPQGAGPGPRPPPQGAALREQPIPRSQGPDRGPQGNQPRRDREREQGEERGKERNR